MIKFLDTIGVKKQSETNTITCAEMLIRTLVSLEVRDIFGYPGASVLSIYNELFKAQSIRHILVRHEQAAVHMAEGYARTKNKTGVVLVTSGPGFTNTVTGIANAYADSTPIVILAGDVAQNNKAGKVFQKTDIPSVIATCTKKCIVVTPKEDIKQVIEDAFITANSGKKGPVVVVLPRNVLETKYIPHRINKKSNNPIFNIQTSEYTKCFNLLKNAKRPLLLLGAGASNAVDKINEFVQKTGIPVVSTLMGIGIFPSNNNLYLGMVGINGTYSANMAINNADVVLALGVSFSDRTTCKNSYFARNAKILSVNIEHTFGCFKQEILSDIQMFLSCLLKISQDFNKNNLSEWHKKISLYKEENMSLSQTANSLSSSYVLEAIYKYTEKFEPIVITDVGQHQLLTAKFFNFNKPNKFITSGGLGTMGFGLPAAIGAQIANPQNLVLNITGDGSFQMNLQELATCREHSIPIKIIIMNNGYLGMVRQMQENIYSQRYQVEMINPDFTKIAEAYDLFAIRVTNAKSLIPALEKAINYKGTAILDIAIDAFEEI